MSTYTPIASQTLSAAASSVTFSGIPQTYTDLVMAVVPAQASAGQGDIYIQFNSDGGSNYSATALYGSGSAAGSTRQSSQTGIRPEYYGYPDTVVGKTVQVYHIMNYSNSTTYKTLLSRANSAAQGTDAVVGLWRSTAAITSITLTMNAGASFISGSTFNLYGIAAGSPKAFGGDIVTTDGTYYYHTFLSSGTFTPSVALSNVDYLVVAGGGGAAGVCAGGGGGARASEFASTLTLSSSTKYTVTVGAGGAGGYNANSNGGDSQFATISASGGGKGGSDSNGFAGGSGGAGGNEGGTGTKTGGAGNVGGYTPVEGYAGGGSTKNRCGGGGGGSNGVGSSTTTDFIGANGGPAKIFTIAGSTYYAGGGGGGGRDGAGTGGNGGGGNGGWSGLAGQNGTANTGGGGGGDWNVGNKNGGSGIVIIRYAV